MILDRLTLDFDHYESQMEMRAVRAYYGLQRLDIVDEVSVHVSTGGKGLHIEAQLSEVLDEDTRFALRRGLNDDDKRVDLDEVRMALGHAGDIFWSEKEGNDGEREEMAGIWPALDRLEATTGSGYSRVKSLSKHGRKAAWDTHGPFSRPSIAEMDDDRVDVFVPEGDA